jgi:hypothetical protein
MLKFVVILSVVQYSVTKNIRKIFNRRKISVYKYNNLQEVSNFYEY